MSTTNEVKSVVLWHLNGCIATFYETQENDGQKRKVPIDTVSFTKKAYLAFRQVDTLRIAAPAVPYLIHLSSLQLQNNNLKSLPSELWRLTSLTELNLGNNKLEELPKEIGLLVNLEELFIHNNQITNIPSQIGRLLRLTVLDLTDNKLVNLPGELLKLNLKSLWIDLNDFDSYNYNNYITSFISLKSICAQTAGLLSLQDEESKKAIQDVPILQDDGLLSINNLNIIPTCYHCSAFLFHPGLQVVKKDDKIPLVFRACSQNCYIKLFNNLNFVQQ